KDIFRGLIDVDDGALLVDRNDGVGSGFSKGAKARLTLAQRLFVLFPHQQLPDLRADWSHHFQQCFVGLHRLTLEEFNYADDFSAYENREAKAAAQSFVRD